MGEREPVTEMVKASEARQQWSQLLNWVFRKGTHMIVEKSGIPVAAIVSADDLRRPERLEAERAADLAILDEMQDAFRGVPWEEIEREIARAIGEMHAERCREQATTHTP